MRQSPIHATDVKHVVKAHWGNRAPTFDAAPNHGIHSAEQQTVWLAVLTRLTAGTPGRVLDIGCGTGFLALLLAGVGHRVDGLDIAPAMLDQARTKARRLGLAVRFLEGDAEALAMTDGSYDVVVERHVIWTLPQPDRALAEWRRVLRPGGRVALVEGAWGRRDQVPPAYAAIHAALPLYGGSPAPVLAELLAAAGFVEVEIEPLTDPRLWGGEVAHDRYLVTATRI